MNGPPGRKSWIASHRVYVKETEDGRGKNKTLKVPVLLNVEEPAGKDMSVNKIACHLIGFWIRRHASIDMSFWQSYFFFWPFGFLGAAAGGAFFLAAS